MDRRKLAGITLDNVESLCCNISLEEMHKVFKARWEPTGAFQGLGGFLTNGRADNSAFKVMITAKEIAKNIKEMSRNAAPGPDELTLRHLIEIDPDYTQIRELFNPWLLSGTIPDMVKECRTVLISKSALPERQNDINNWRTITTGSIVRLFSKVLTTRLTKNMPN